MGFFLCDVPCSPYQAANIPELKGEFSLPVSALLRLENNRFNCLPAEVRDFPVLLHFLRNELHKLFAVFLVVIHIEVHVNFIAVTPDSAAQCWVHFLQILIVAGCY